MRCLTRIVFALYICASTLHATEPRNSNDNRVETIAHSVTIYREDDGGFRSATNSISLPNPEPRAVRGLAFSNRFRIEVSLTPGSTAPMPVATIGRGEAYLAEIAHRLGRKVLAEVAVCRKARYRLLF